MRYLIVLCCLLFAWRGGENESLYFDGYVTLKAETVNGVEETNAKVKYVFKGSDEEASFELTLTVGGDSKNPLIISGLIRKLANENSVGVYSADGKYQIGIGKLKDDGETTEMTFDLLVRGIKISEVKLEQKVSVGDDGPGVYLNFKLSALAGDAVETSEVYFEGNLPLDLAKSMRCSVNTPADDC